MWNILDVEQQGRSGQPDAFTGILLFQSGLKYRKSRSMNVKNQVSSASCAPRSSWGLAYVILRTPGHMGRFPCVNNDSMTFMKPLGIHGLVDSGSPQSFQ